VKNLNEFERLVFEMRKQQKSYFKTRNQGTLRLSKQYEIEVDKRLSEKINNQQQGAIDFG